MKNKYSLVISVCGEKVLEKIQYPLIIKKKNLYRLGMEGTLYKITKAIYNKQAVNIILKWGKLKSSPSYLEQDKYIHFNHSYSI